MLKVQTGSTFVDQWKSEYVAQALPFTFSRAVGGPQYGDEIPARRRFEDSPLVSSSQFTRGMAHRVESQFRTDWNCMPLLRNLHFRKAVLCSKKIWSGSAVVAGQAADADVNPYIEAAQGLHSHLKKGTYKHQCGKQLPLKGDVSKLLYAHGITQEQKQLLRNMQFV